MGRCKWNIGRHFPGDSRITLFRYTTDKYMYREGWKISVSLHPKFFYWRREYRAFRLTILGLNVHYRAA